MKLRLDADLHIDCAARQIRISVIFYADAEVNQQIYHTTEKRIKLYATRVTKKRVNKCH